MGFRNEGPVLHFLCGGTEHRVRSSLPSICMLLWYRASKRSCPENENLLGPLQLHTTGNIFVVPTPCPLLCVDWRCVPFARLCDGWAFYAINIRDPSFKQSDQFEEITPNSN